MDVDANAREGNPVGYDLVSLISSGQFAENSHTPLGNFHLLDRR